jgi:hypothetical protein
MLRGRGRANLLDTDELNAFLESLDHVDRVELLRMGAVWQAVDKPAHEKAWAAVRAIGARDGLSKEIDEIRERAMAWARRGDDGVPYAFGDNDMWAQMKMEAEGAIVDIALGIALGDRLDERTRETLLAAWVGAR